MRLKRNRLAAAIAVSTVALLSSQQVLSNEGFLLEEIVVTATKRAESVQDIPLAVTAVDAGLLEQRSINDIESLATSVPGLHFSQSGSDTQITIRGIGSEQNSVTGDPGVAFHIDGVYQSRSSAGSALLYDLDRIEVLRGPQGTLYGRNATGGSINVISKRPDQELGGKLEYKLGNYNQHQVSGVLNAPLIEDKLLSRISFQQEKRDGYYENVSAGQDDLDDIDSQDLRAQFLYFPNDQMEVLLSLNYSTDKGASNAGGHNVGTYGGAETGRVANMITSGFALLPVGTIPGVGGFGLFGVASMPASADPTDEWEVSTNGEHSTDDERMGASLTFEWDLGSVALKSITAWQDNLVDQVRDIDFTDAEVMNERRLQDSRQYSQELQLSSTDDSALQWLAGVYWLEEETEADFWVFDDGRGLSSLVYTANTLLDAGNPPFGLNGFKVFQSVDTGLGFSAIGGNQSVIDSESLGAFAQIKYEINEDLKMTAGLRYSKDTKSADIRYKGFGDFFNQPEVSHKKSDSWESVTGKLGLDWYVTDDSMLYASVSTGFKSGGFLQDPDSDSYDEENITAYEFGSKNRFLEGRLQANISAYYYDYEDMQLSTIVDNQLVTTNAGKADILGIDLELMARPIEALILSATLAHTRAKFVDYSADDPTVAGISEEVLDGNELARSPDWTFNLSAAYTVDLALGSVTASANMFWSDEVYFSAFNRKDDAADYQGNYHTTDLRLQFDSADDAWHIALAVKNLENELIASNGFARSSLGGPEAFVQWQAPRTYSVSAGYNF